MRLTVRSTFVVVLALAASAVGGSASAWASTGPHWTIAGVAQEGSGIGGASETVGLKVGAFKMRVGLAENIECNATTGTGNVKFTSPGTGEMTIHFTCKIGGQPNCEITPFELHGTTTLKAVKGVIYDVLSGEHNPGGKLFTLIIKNKSEFTCNGKATYPVTGSIGAAVGAEAVEPTLTFSELNETASGTSLKTEGVFDWMNGVVSPKLTGVNAGKLLGATL